VAFGSGTGAIASVSHLASSTWNGPQSVAAGDVNGDGKADLVTANTYDNIVDVLLGTGAGAFAAPQGYATGSSPISAEIADFNGDGTIDLMTANSGDGSVSVLLGAGSGIFRPPSNLPVATGPRAVATGDFNGDSRRDAAAVNSGSNNVSVLLNDGAWPSVDAPVITIGDATVTEGNSGTINATLTVSLSKASTQTVTVKYATADGSATAGDDYVAAAATLLTFTPGQTSKTITVQVEGDQVAESTESFAVILSEATNAFLSDTSGAVTILDNEPSITIDDVTAAEGNSGTKTFTFTVHLSAASDAPVSVNYSTAEGDTDYWPYNPYSYYYGPPAATSGTDFVAKSGTVTFATGETSKTVTVVVNGDRTGESDEAFSVDLASASGAHLVDDHAVGTVVNDDPFVHVAGGSVTEGNSGTTVVPFTITLSNPTDVSVTVGYATADGTATTAGSDYVAKSGSVTFAPGETSKTVNVTVNGDGVAEGDEFLQLVLGTVTDAGIGTAQATGYILDDDVKGISINNVSITEGNNGSTKLMTFTVTLSSASTQPVTVSYSTQNGTAKSGKDYTAKSGTITFAAGQTSKTITISIKGDKQRESNEIFYVLLRNPSSNAVLDDAWGEGTILNDD
jgi:large repetitive protein